MIGRLLIALVVAGLLATVPPPRDAQAHADAIVARDTLISRIFALGGAVVYQRGFEKTPKRAWMVSYDGHLREATGIPRGAGVGDVGRDARGRVVFTVGRLRDRSATTPIVDWFVYDPATNRARPLRGLPSGCTVDRASLWRDSLAYERRCAREADSGVFVRQGTRTTKVAEDYGANRLAFRAGTLAATLDDGNDDVLGLQYMANGRRCFQHIDAAFGDATDYLDSFFPTDIWVAHGQITWTMGRWSIRPKFAILSAKIRPGCAPPGPVGEFPFKPETATVQALTVDGRHVFYADGRTLRSHKLPPEPYTGPAPNDDFEHAKRISGDAPVAAIGRIAHATVQRGEPLSGTGHTVWYRFRPRTSGTVYVSLPASCPARPPQGCEWDLVYGVYTGTRRSALTQLPSADNGTIFPNDDYTQVEAKAGDTYWIAVATDRDTPRYAPFRLSIDAQPPPPLYG